MSLTTAAIVNDILNRTAAEVGLTPVANPWADTSQHFMQMQQLLNTCGEELTLAHVWEWQQYAYHRVVQPSDADGLELPDNFLQMIDQTGWDRRSNVPISGPLSSQEWTYLAGRNFGGSTIYASFRLAAGKLLIYPHPPPVGLDVNFEYQSKNWVENYSASSPVLQDQIVTGSDKVLFDRTLIVKALKLKWLGAKGFDTTVPLNEFETIFNMLTGKDKGGRILSAGRGRHGSQYLELYQRSSHWVWALMALVSQQNSLQASVRPAPNGGMDARAAVGAMPDDASIYSYNLTPAEYGMLLRAGFKEHQIGLTGDGGVRTLIPFNGATPGLVDDRLFAVTPDGIWDVTNVAEAPVLDLSFVTTTSDAGHGVTLHYANDADRNTLFYADGENGLFFYTTAAGTWAPVTDIVPASGETLTLDLTNVCFVMVHKERMWLIEKGANYAWYLGPGASSGEAWSFSFAGKFPHGGSLYGLFNWTVDGGMGVDDYLVGVSSAGDIIPYQGLDPSTTDGAAPWQAVGTYYVGEIPRGRRFASEYSGELYLLSAFGLIAMSDLLKGVDSANPSENSLAFKIARPLRRDITTKIDMLGWEPVFVPPLGELVITTPKGLSQNDLQYVMNLAVEGWGMWRGVPAQCIEDWNGKVYFGTNDGRICSMDSTLDNVLLTPDPEMDINGKAVEFSLLSSYTDLGTGAIHKQVQFTRPNLFSPQAPSYTIKVLYDYAYSEPTLRYDSPRGGASAWDVGLWDDALWSSSTGVAQYSLEGSAGIGRTCAIAMRGASLEEMRLFSWDIMWKVGGPI